MDVAYAAEQLALDLAQTVVIGRFNPYIVTPTWLVEQGICGDDDLADDTDDFLDPDEPAFGLGGYEWYVTMERMTVSTGRRDLDCGQMAARVLRKLPHTPVEAVGHNFIFACSAAQWGGRPVPALGSEARRPPLESRWVGRYRENPGETVEVELTVLPNQVVVLRLNYDLRVTTGEAVEAAGQFSQDYARAALMIQDLFQIAVP